jgi:hypothetical protein
MPRSPVSPVQGEAAVDLVRRVAAADSDPLYVVAIGAITSVASATLLEPEIIRRIVVVWLGSQTPSLAGLVILALEQRTQQLDPAQMHGGVDSG